METPANSNTQPTKKTGWWNPEFRADKGVDALGRKATSGMPLPR